jgi:hypothetical protein
VYRIGSQIHNATPQMRMIESSCHCGAVRLDMAAVPAAVTGLRQLDRRRYGVWWAYYAPKDACVAGATDTYPWDEKKIFFHRCRICGCVSHWSAVHPHLDRMGVDARLMPPEIVGKARVHRLDGAGTEEYVD